MNTVTITTYGLKKKATSSFQETCIKIQELLKEEGFGILTSIDVTETLKKKLAIDYPNYLIFGVCHPQSAYKALQIDKELGLLLPCNVIIYEENNTVFVSAIRPTVALEIAQKPELHHTAKLIEQKLQKVLEKII